MVADNLSAVLYGKGDLRLEQRPIPEPTDNQVLLRMATVGICGSDIHYWTSGRIASHILKTPMILGHESAGVVIRCGKNVKNLTPGDRVAIEPGVPCRSCDDCKAGRYNLCVDIAFCATPPINGNLSRYYCHAADFCYKLPDHVSMEEGSLLEPISIGVYACNRAGVKWGSKVLITGAGPIGLVNLLVAKAMGASTVVMTDVVQSRLNFAKTIGADHTFTVSNTTDTDKLAMEIKNTLLGAMPDVSIDACGMASSMALCMSSTRNGGCVCVIGFGPEDVTVPLNKAMVREVDIRGIFRYVNCYPLALAMIASGKIDDIKKLITHRFTIEQTLEAFETSKTGAAGGGGAIKVMISC